MAVGDVLTFTAFDDLPPRSIVQEPGGWVVQRHEVYSPSGEATALWSGPGVDGWSSRKLWRSWMTRMKLLWLPDDEQARAWVAARGRSGSS